LVPCADGHHQRLEAQGAQPWQREIAMFPNAQVAVIFNVRVFQDVAELFAQSFFHLQLIVIDTIFSQSTGFDIPVEQHNLRPMAGELLGSI
jgi:hypothetical protein